MLVEEVITGVSGNVLFGKGAFIAPPPPPQADSTTRQAGIKTSFKKFKTIFMGKLTESLLLFNSGQQTGIVQCSLRIPINNGNGLIYPILINFDCMVCALPYL
jgi:hypothetical protein